MGFYRYLVTKKVGNEQLVREVDRKRHRELVMSILTGVVLTAAVLAYGWQHWQMIRIGYRMEELRVERERLLELRRALELERAALTAPDRIESIARKRLGMRPPDVSQLVVVEPVAEPDGAAPGGVR